MRNTAIISALVLLASSFSGAFLQSSIGFGCAVIMMNIITFVFPTGKAIIVCQSGCILLALMILRKRTDRIRWDVILPIMIPSLICTFIATRISIGINIGLMKMLIGILFILLSVYFTVFASKIRIEPGKTAGITLGVVSGTFNGFFSVAGPPAMLYLAPALEDRDELLSSAQVFFLATNTMSLTVRLLSRQAERSDILFILLCFAGIISGSVVGTKVSGKLKGNLLKRLIYIFIGINGIIIVLTSGALKSNSVSISLDENPTTGYRWEMSINPEGVLELTDDQYATSASKGIVGAPGVRTFTFDIIEKQQATITFVLRRSWETEPPIETKKFIFRPDKNVLEEVE